MFIVLMCVMLWCCVYVVILWCVVVFVIIFVLFCVVLNKY
jgi:hypothetical protein